jgi:hypothetical protein
MTDQLIERSDLLQAAVESCNASVGQDFTLYESMGLKVFRLINQPKGAYAFYLVSGDKRYGVHVQLPIKASDLLVRYTEAVRCFREELDVAKG